MTRLAPVALALAAACTTAEAPRPERSCPEPAPTRPSTPPAPTTPGGRYFLEDAAFYQAIAVPVLEEGRGVTTGERTAPLVARRPAVVKVHLVGDDGDVEVALDLTADGDTRTFTGSGAAASDLVIDVPADAMVPGATWALRVIAGGAQHDRWPEVGGVPLDAIETGPLKVRLVPFEAGGFVPDTSAAVVEGYRAALLATYPVTDVEISVAEVEVWDGPVDLGDINYRVGVLQEEAMFSGAEGWDVTWYGMVSGVATRDEFEGVTGTSENGGNRALDRSYFAAGAAFGDAKSEDTLIHEIGHTYGLFHVACDGEGDTDPHYPHPGGTIGIEGWDLRTGEFLEPSGHFDLMTYCFPRWVSDYAWAKLARRVQETQRYPTFH